MRKPPPFKIGDRVKKTKPTWLFNDQCGTVKDIGSEKAYVVMDSCKEEDYGYWFWHDELTKIEKK